jgi:cell division protein FtsQ
MKSTPRRLFRTSIFLLLIVVCVYFFLHSAFFQVDTIEVTGNSVIPAQEIIDMAGIESGIKLFEANENLVCKAVELHPMVKEAQLVRHLPRKLEIKITERSMWAVIPAANEFLIIDTEGVCINKSLLFPAAEVPLVTLDPVPQRILMGQAVEPQGIDLIKKVWDGLSSQERDQISDFHYASDSQELIIYTAQGTEIRFGENERLDEKLSAISQVFQLENEFLKSGQEALVYVDIRYKGQPVVRTTS